MTRCSKSATRLATVRAPRPARTSLGASISAPGGSPPNSDSATSSDAEEAARPGPARPSSSDVSRTARRSLQTDSEPQAAAKCRGVCPAKQAASATSQPSSDDNSTSQVRAWPRSAARCNAVRPRSSRHRGSAPCCSSSAATRAMPCRAAQCKGVWQRSSGSKLSVALHRRRMSQASTQPQPAAKCSALASRPASGARPTTHPGRCRSAMRATARCVEAAYRAWNKCGAVRKSSYMSRSTASAPSPIDPRTTRSLAIVDAVARVVADAAA
mmetsp:Transcript_125965/g.352706  ORF Transcript_125965/g.352706 Transcript_125965/m.352706 type:complete len:270 (-) Transcript_125965:8-817(-)